MNDYQFVTLSSLPKSNVEKAGHYLSENLFSRNIQNLSKNIFDEVSCPKFFMLEFFIFNVRRELQ